jgi:hypothetical protein
MIKASEKSVERRHLSPRGFAETLATVVIAAGVIMLMQPISLALYGWSFLVTLVGTAMFTVASKLPE